MKVIIKGVDCDFIDEMYNAWGIPEPVCKKRIYDISCLECRFNRLKDKQNKFSFK